MIEIGKYNKLKIKRTTRVGLYLENEEGEDVLLPTKYSPLKYETDDEIEVFVYLDNEGRKVATNLTPKILVNEFAFLQVSTVSKVGAFMDWGLAKELLVPFREQKQRMEEGRWYIVYMTVDEKTNRLYASNKLDKFLKNDNLTVKENEEVQLMIMHKTDIGFSVIVNNKHLGLVYENEIFSELNIGDRMKGFVKKVREDNKLDISLQAHGYDLSIDPNCDIILKKILAGGGALTVTDKSSPDEIYETFGMSKKAFKKALGALYKQRKVEFHPDQIKLL
ncbi:S1 RNA-binding domain-containing protein [Bacteroidota bacterium]